MNQEQIEKLLRQAPEPKIPADLLQKLKADIRLPRAVGERAERPAVFGFKRWVPALSFASIAICCAVAIGVQAGTVSRLTRENADLRAEIEKLKSSPANTAEYQRLRNENQELDRLRRDYADVQRLREEAARLGGNADEITSLRQENQQLTAQIAAAGAAGKTSADGDFLADAKARADRIKCVNNLKQIGLAARIWANDNQGVEPPDFLSMTNEMVTPLILQCPGDKSRNVTNWSQVASGNISYQMLAPGAKDTEPQVVFVFCPLHRNYCLADGSVQQLSAEGEKQHLKVVDGKTIFQ